MLTAERVPYRFIEFWSFHNFSYYSLIAEGQERSIAGKTIDALEADAETALITRRFVQMMKQIGMRCRNLHERGILRGEGPARALPPDAWLMKRIRYLNEFGDLSPVPSLRWYSYPADYQVLLLFGLGLKTRNDPSDCPNVARLFKFAVRASDYLNDHSDDWTVNGLNLVLTDEETPLLL